MGRWGVGFVRTWGGGVWQFSGTGPLTGRVRREVVARRGRERSRPRAQDTPRQGGTSGGRHTLGRDLMRCTLRYISL